MSHNSRKRKLINDLIEDFKYSVVLNNDNYNFKLEIDQLVDNLELIHSYRYLVPRYKQLKSDHWSTSILPVLDDNRFRCQLRVTREQFQHILSEIAHHPSFHKKTNKQITVEKQLAIFLFRAGHSGNGASYNNIAQKFAISDGGTITNISRVIGAILSLKNKYVYWPDPEERDTLEELISSHLPGCVGFLDGTHIPLVEKPSVQFPDDYYSRKQKYSLHLQVVCNYNKKIRHYKVGKVGSVHDAKVFNDSIICQYPNRYFSTGQFLAGDAAYKLTQHCITPFRKNSRCGNAVERRKFNRHFSRYRVKVEHCFGVLKEKFCSLNDLRLKIVNNETNIFACQWIEACCILYNITLNAHDSMYYNLLQSGNIIEPENICYEPGNVCGEARRQLQFNYIVLNV